MNRTEVSVTRQILNLHEVMKIWSFLSVIERIIQFNCTVRIISLSQGLLEYAFELTDANALAL